MDDTGAPLFQFLSHYGLGVLFAWLLFGIFIVPVPEEVVMLTVGMLISRGDFSLAAYAIAVLGSLCGVTFSYFLGRYLGRFLVVKYGKWIGITRKRLTRADHWFERYGKWSLPIGYFVPGVRHLLSIAAGTSHFNFKYFVLFSYPAGIVWVVTVVSLGYVAGKYWLNAYTGASAYIYYGIVFVLFVAMIFFVTYLFRLHKKVKKGEDKEDE
jgi:membrane protein DedA with SNARE-associated domain